MWRWTLLLAVVAGLLPVAFSCGCCERNATLSECGQGAELRARPDCKCCLACGRLQGETCNDAERPCAGGLDCGSEGLCTEPQKCRSDGDCDESRFCLGGVCTDPCQVLDHCDGLLSGGACQPRNHRPVCTCPPTLTLDAERKACVKGASCQDEDGKQVPVGESTSRNSCQETCLCEPSGKLNCTQTQCPPGLYVSGAFADDPTCVELRSPNVDNDCCVSVVCPDTPPAKEQTTSPAAPSAAADTAETAPSEPTSGSLGDVLPLTITHNSTRLQLPGGGGRLTYRADGRPPVAVPAAEGEQQVTVTDLQPGTGYVFTWISDTGNKKLRVNTRPGCVTNTSSFAIGETYHMGCQSTCVCGGQNQPSCRSRCSFTRGTVTDLSCSERPDPDDPECCVKLVCAGTNTAGEIATDEPETTTSPPTPTTSETTNDPSTTTTPTPTPTTPTTSTSTTTTTTTEPATTEPATATEPTTTASAAPVSSTAPLAETQPKPTLIVTARSHNSATLAWDDFQPPQYTLGYVLQYRRVGDEQWSRRELPPQRGKTVPLAKVDGLTPSGEYEARVSLHEDQESGALGESTETTRFTTDAGCVEGAMSYGLGEKFSRGCEESCSCALDGQVRCELRCPPPLFRAGHFAADPLCRESPLDDCCVTAVCDTAPLEDEPQQGADGMDQCEFVHCGPHSRCQMQKSASAGAGPDAMDAHCVCLAGFSESWDQPGSCVEDPGNVILNATGCEFEGKLYSPGDEFFKSCEYKCRCSMGHQIECKPRCKVDQATMLELPPGCVRVQEPEPNEHCCMELRCDESAASTEEATSERPSTEATLLGETVSPRFGAARLEPAASEIRIVSLKPIDAGASSVQVTLPEAVTKEFSTSLEDAPLTVEWRRGDGAWQSATVPHRLLHLNSGLLTALVTGMGEPSTATVRVTFNGETSAEVRGADLVPVEDAMKVEEQTDMMAEKSSSEPAADIAEPAPDFGFDCVFNGTSYKIGDEFHEGCRQFCLCTQSGVSCASIECPHHFGLKLINPDCLEWSEPENFLPTPPNCCPEVTCVDDGSCQFNGETFRNLEKLPEKLTGCDVCYCEFGNVTCQSACSPVPATPPRELPCTPDKITLGPGANGCCKLWQCSDDGTASETTGRNETTDVDSTTVTDFGGSTSLDIVQPTEPSLAEPTDAPSTTDLEEPTPEPEPTTEAGEPTPKTNTPDSENSPVEPETTPEPEPTSEAPEDPGVAESATPLKSVEDSITESSESVKAPERTVESSPEASVVIEDASLPQAIPGPEDGATPEQEPASDENSNVPAAPEKQPNKVVVIDGQRYINSNGKLFPLPSLPNFVRPGGSARPSNPAGPRPTSPEISPSQQDPAREEPGIRDGIGGLPPRRPPAAPPQEGDNEAGPSVVVIDGQRFLESGGKLFPLPGAPDVTGQEQGRPQGPVIRPGPQSIRPVPGRRPTSGSVLIPGEHPGSLGHPAQNADPAATGGHPAQGQRPVPGIRPISGTRPVAGGRPTRPGPGVHPVLVGPNGERIHLGPDGRPLRPTSPGRRPDSPGRRPIFGPHSQESPEIIVLPNGQRVQVFPDGSARPLSRPQTSQRPQQQRKLIAIGRDGRPILGPDGRPITIPASAARRPTGAARPPHQQQQHQQQQQQQQQRVHPLQQQQQRVHPLQQQRPPSRGGAAGGSLGTFAPGDRIPIDNRGRPIPIGPNGPVRTPVFDIVIGEDGQPVTDDDGRTMLFPVQGGGGGGGGGGPPPHRGQEPDDATLLLQHLATSTQAPPQGQNRPNRHEEVTSRPSVPSSVHTEGLGIGNNISNLRVRDVQSDSVQFSFSIPPALVGLPGTTEVLYTNNPGFHAESSEWDRRVFQTPSGRLDHTSFVWTLGDLQPATTYVMQAKVLFDKVSTILQSNIIEFQTRDAPEPLPPKVELDAELQDLTVNTDSAEIQWRRLSEQELEYIDGIQLRYRDVDVDAQVWTMTPFIHRELTSYRLTDLKPDTSYEVDIVLMPFADTHTEMVSSHPIKIHTQPVVDRYAFNISLTNVEPSPTSVRVNWTGVPKPQYQFVNVYRIVYIYEKEREEKHTFKLAKTSESPSVLIKGLKPSSKYQVWLEAYLKNGKKQVSEVREFVTKPGQIGKAEEIRVDAAGFGGKLQPSDDYYGGMVAAAIIATIAILLCLFLAFLLVRRPAPPGDPAAARKNGPSYENPAFKPPETFDSAPSETTSTTIST